MFTGRLSLFLDSDNPGGCGGGGWSFFFGKGFILEKHIRSSSDLLTCNLAQDFSKYFFVPISKVSQLRFKLYPTVLLLCAFTK